MSPSFTIIVYYYFSLSLSLLLPISLSKCYATFTTIFWFEPQCDPTSQAK